MSTRDLIDAIESKNSSAIQREFHEAIMSRVAERLDAMRIEVAKNMFSESTELGEGTDLARYHESMATKHAKAMKDTTDNAVSHKHSTAADLHLRAKTAALGGSGYDAIAKRAKDASREAGLNESADLHKDRLEQILADHDINSHVEGDTVHVDQDDVKKAQKIVKNYGYDHQVQGGLNEVLSKKAKASEWISDFVHSKDPKFAGKSKEQRIKMALGAYYAKQRDEAAECRGKTIEEEGCGTRDDQPKFKLKLKRSTDK